MACCKNHITYLDNWCKGHPIVFTDEEGKEYCVFHAPAGEKGIPPEEFKEKVFKEINQAKENGKDCDLSGTVFEWYISFSEFNKDNPLPEINFSLAKFSKKADFSRAKFSGKADFSDAKFKEADFSAAKFKEADFSSAKFSKWANFYRAKFKDALFHSASFEGRAVFERVAIEERLCFQNLKLKKPSFLGTDLRKCDFIACRWHEEDGRFILYDETELMEKEEYLLAKANAGRLKKLWVRDFSTTDVAGMKQVEDLYRTMKQKARDKHDEFAYSHWHYSEKQMQRKSAGSDRLFQFTVLNLYWLSSGYGEEPRRAGLLLAILFLLAYFLIGAAGLAPAGAEQAQIIYMDSLPNAGRIFTATLGHLTFQRSIALEPATDCGRLVVTVFKLMITLQAALFAIALRNRFRR